MIRFIIINHTFAFLLPLILGFFVFIKGVKKKINQIYFLLCIFIAAWAFANLLIYLGYMGMCDPKFGYRLAIFFASFQAPTLLLFSWFFPKEAPSITSKHIITIYAISLFFAAFSFSNFYLKKLEFTGELQMITSFGLLYYAFTIFFLSFAILSAINLLKSYFTIESSMEKTRIRYFLIGLFIAYSVGITFSLVLSVLGSETYEYLGTIGPNIFVIFSTYSIVKHRLMDINLIIRKGIVYSSIVGLFTGLYLITIFILSQTFQIFTGQSSMLAAILLLLVFAFAFQPLKNYIQTQIDRLFFKEKYNYQKTLKELSHASATIIDLNALLKLVSKTIVDRININGTSIYTFDKDKSIFTLKEASIRKG